MTSNDSPSTNPPDAGVPAADNQLPDTPTQPVKPDGGSSGDIVVTDGDVGPVPAPAPAPIAEGDLPAASTPGEDAEAGSSLAEGQEHANGPEVMSGGKITTPLPETSGPPSPPLPDGQMVTERFQVISLLGVVRDSNIYRVADTQGYRRCWACGSTSSLPGDIYCVECGAQLAGRHYRLQEFNLPRASSDAGGESDLPVAQAFLDNRVPGVAHAYDHWVNDDASRAYVAWEEATGRTLSSWLPGLSAIDALMASQSGHLAVPQEPEEEQALAWMVQAADLLSSLHAEGLGGCAMELGDLLVQPGDRLVLLDPSACRDVSSMEAAERERLEMSDVRHLAGTLEQWYMAVRKDAAPAPPSSGDAMVPGNGDTEPTSAGSPASGSAPSTAAPPAPPILPESAADVLVPAYEVTGPLGRGLNPTVVFARAREGSYPTAEAFAEALRDLYEANKPLTDLKLWSGRSTDVGRVRKINEDSVLTLEATVLEHEGTLPVALYVIADGMGGHQSGEVASSIAARTIGALVNSSLIGALVAGDPVARDLHTCAHLLQQAVLEANRRITDLARERHSDLGTTTVAALLIGNQLTIANVGDSRAYLWRDGQAQVITRDHSLVMQLVAAGQISINDIYTHPRRNEIYRALGDTRLTDAEIDIYNLRLRPGDGLLLCSDGLWDFVRDPDISAILATPGADPQALTQELVNRANANGGEDNISVIFARILSSET